jgi:hypothetical protein
MGRKKLNRCDTGMMRKEDYSLSLTIGDNHGIIDA